MHSRRHVCLQLDTGVDTSALVDVGILVEDTNDVALGGVDNASSSDDGDVTHLVVIDAFYVDFWLVQSYVGTS